MTNDERRSIIEDVALAPVAVTEMLLDRLSTAESRASAAEREAERMRKALRDLIDSVGGHDHWDSTMMHGAGCPICITQREAKDRARAALAGSAHEREGE